MPDFFLSGALSTMRPGDAFRIANAARPAGDYLFNALLPEIPKSDYQARSGSMTVRSIMPGMVGADSPYPDTMAMEISTFTEETAKFANKVRLPERTLRELQALMMRLMLNGQSTNEAIVREALNFLDKVIVQGHLDLMEYLRGQALCTGGLDWTFNGIRLLVDYAIPSANKLTVRTGNDGYGGSTSKFWADVRSIRRQLKGNVRAIIAHPDLIDTIRYNTANSLVATGDYNGSGPITFRKVNSQGNFTQDAADTVTLIAYGLEGEILDPATKATSLVF